MIYVESAASFSLKYTVPHRAKEYRSIPHTTSYPRFTTHLYHAIIPNATPSQTRTIPHLQVYRRAAAPTARVPVDLDKLGPRLSLRQSDQLVQHTALAATEAANVASCFGE